MPIYRQDAVMVGADSVRTWRVFAGWSDDEEAEPREGGGRLIRRASRHDPGQGRGRE